MSASRSSKSRNTRRESIALARGRLVMIARALDVPVTSLMPDGMVPLGAQPSLAARVAASRGGIELLTLFLDLAPDRQASLLSVAKALAGDTALTSAMAEAAE